MDINLGKATYLSMSFLFLLLINYSQYEKTYQFFANGILLKRTMAFNLLLYTKNMSTANKSMFRSLRELCITGITSTL